MEPLLLFVLFAALSDEKTKSSLLSFLSFYRENRELFSSVMNGAPKDGPAASEPEKEESPQGADSLKIIEEYLKRTS